MNTNVLVYFLFIVAQAATPASPPTPSPTLSNMEFTQTPTWQAVCLTGKGNVQVYADAAKRLADFLVSKGEAPESEFSTTWKPGSGGNSTQTDAEWDVCAQSAPLDGVQSPFVFKTLAAQDAGHAQCKARTQSLQGCFASLIKFVTDSGKTPIAPPRYKKMSENQEDVPTFDIWIPVSSTPVATSAPR